MIYRSYYAFIKNPRINSKGLNTSAVFGFTLTLDEILRKEKPTHISVVFDPPGPTFRHESYAEYKANRPPMPEDLRSSLPYIREVIKAFNVNQVEVSGFEADDVIGTLAKKAELAGFDVYMMTPDKDYGQLVSERIRMYRPRRGKEDPEVLGKNEICRNFKISDPIQVIDVLALWGDTADNIPGAPGIGEKGAKDLISHYGSITGIYEHLDEFKGKRKENLINFKDQIDRAKWLVTIKTDVDIDFNPADLEVTNPDLEGLSNLFATLEFNTLKNRILADYGIAAPPEAQESSAVQGSLFATGEIEIEDEEHLSTLASTEADYQLVDDEQSIKGLVNDVMSQSEFCFDTETTGINALSAELVGLAIAVKPKQAFYIPFPEDQVITKERLEWLRPLFENTSQVKIAQNLKYDAQVLANYGIAVQAPTFDTMLAHYLLEADMRHNLDDLARHYLSYKMVSISELIGEKGKAQKSMRSVPLEQQVPYAGEDADITLQLKSVFARQLKDHDLVELFEQIEMPLVPVLAAMERDGIRMDPSSLDDFREELRRDIIKLEADIIELAGVQFNIGSPKQLGEILFDHLKIDPHAKRTKSKQYSTAEDVLTKLAGKHPIVNKVLTYRGLRKLLNTYVDTLPSLVNPETGKIHTSFNQAVAATGRLSSINPNLQNIPIREERGREIRKTFIPSTDEYIFLSADYSQVELRLMAHLSGDENMIAAFNRDEDIHTATAALINGVGTDQVSKEMRSRAKTANFGIIYGISSFGLAQRLNISRREAKSLIDGYFKSYPGVKQYMDQSIQSARDNGYVKTIMGRRRYLPDILSNNPIVKGNAERNAINAPVQGSAADLIKLAMIRIYRELEKNGLKTRMILQVHDELNFDVYKPELNQVREIIRHEMEHAMQLRVPLVVDMGTGENWFEAH